jgi:hypothetical protein
MKIKLIVGFRRDQEHTIDANEAHKAYYLFLHPEQRGVFSNGLAIQGSQIQEIVPDWQGTMGWNPSHVLNSDDWNEIRQHGKEGRMKTLLAAAKEIAQIGTPEDLQKPLFMLLKTKYPQLMASNERKGGMQSMKEISTQFKMPSSK